MSSGSLSQTLYQAATRRKKILSVGKGFRRTSFQRGGKSITYILRQLINLHNLIDPWQCILVNRSTRLQ